MPWKQVYEPAPKNMSLPVAKDLPLGFVESDIRLMRPYKVAHPQGKPYYETMYFCEHRDCNGWIEGEPNIYRVNTLEPERLAGRRGREFYCRRCGHSIGFIGLMS